MLIVLMIAFLVGIQSFTMTNSADTFKQQMIDEVKVVEVQQTVPDQERIKYLEDQIKAIKTVIALREQLLEKKSGDVLQQSKDSIEIKKAELEALEQELAELTK